MRFCIADLGGHAVTRSRGRRAYEVVRTHLRRGDAVEVDVGTDQPLSLSFLDELVHQLSKARDLDRVTFLVDGRDTLRKLSRIAAIRQVEIGYVDTQTGAKKTVKPFAGHKYVVSTSRSKPLRDLSVGDSDSTP